MVAGEWRAPVGSYADKLALRNIGLHMSFGQVRKAKTLERFQEEVPTVKDKPPLDTNIEFTPVFELPRKQAAAVSRQAKIEAVVAR